MVTARPVSISFVSWFVDWSYRNRATLAALFICLIAGSGFLSYLAKANEDPSAGLGSERVESVARESVPASDPTASDRGAPDSAPTSVAAFADDGDGDTPSGVAGKPGGSKNRTGDVSADAVSMKSVVVETAGPTSSTTTTAPPTTTTTAPPTTTTTAPPTTTTTGPTTTTSTTATKPTVIDSTTTSTDDDDGDDDDDDDGDDDERLATDLSVGRQGRSGGEDEFADWLASFLGDTRRR